MVQHTNAHQIFSALVKKILENPPTPLLEACPSPLSVPAYKFLSSDNFEPTNIHYLNIDVTTVIILSTNK